MSENLKENEQEANGAAELPKPTYQEPSAGEQTSEAAGLSEAQKAELNEYINKEVDRKLQSQKDKRWDELERAYGDLSEVKQALAAAKEGKDPDEIYAALEQRRLYQKVQELEQKVAVQNQPSPGKSEADEAFEKAEEMIKIAGLEEDGKILELLGGNYRTPSEMVSTVAEEIIIRKADPSKAALVAPSGGVPSPSTDLDLSDVDDDNELAEQAFGKRKTKSKR